MKVWFCPWIEAADDRLRRDFRRVFGPLIEFLFSISVQSEISKKEVVQSELKEPHCRNRLGGKYLTM